MRNLPVEPAQRRTAGFVVTVEFLLVTAVFVLPLLFGAVLLTRKAYTLYLDDYFYRKAPYSQPVVVDSKSGTPNVLGTAIGWDPFEAPIIVFREQKKSGGIPLGVRPTRLTTYAEVFYDDDQCTTNPRVRKASEATSPTQSNDNIPTGFLYQDFALATAMGNNHKLYVDSVAYASLRPGPDPSAPLLARSWEALLAIGRRVSVLPRAVTEWRSRISDAGLRFARGLREWASLPVQAATVGDYYLYTGQTGSQTQIDINHSKSWTFTAPSALVFAGGYFTIKRGPSTTATVTLSLYQGTDNTGTLLKSKTLSPSDVTGSFTLTEFTFSSPETLVMGLSYYAELTSAAVDQQAKAYFIKAPPSDTCITKAQHANVGDYSNQAYCTTLAASEIAVVPNDVTVSADAVAGYVWRSQSIDPPTATTPSPPCYAVPTLPADLVAGTEIMTFDNYYTLPFRLVFETPRAAPALPCPNGECN